MSWYDKIKVELDPDRLDEELRGLGDRLKRLLKEGRYTRVRFKYKGKTVLPDIPLPALVATEVATFAWMGPLRALVLNLGVKTLVEVELVHASEEKVSMGQERFLAGEVEEAEVLYRKALALRPDDPSANYHLGVLLKVTGRLDEARVALEAAARHGGHPDAEKARQALGRLAR